MKRTPVVYLQGCQQRSSGESSLLMRLHPCSPMPALSLGGAQEEESKAEAFICLRQNEFALSHTIGCQGLGKPELPHASMRLSLQLWADVKGHNYQLIPLKTIDWINKIKVLERPINLQNLSARWTKRRHCYLQVGWNGGALQTPQIPRPQ